MHAEMDLRNLKPEQVMSYLVECGGALTGERLATGTGWQAELQAMPPVELGVMRIPRDLLVIEGDEAVVTEVVAFMKRKTMRGGG